MSRLLVLLTLVATTTPAWAQSRPAAATAMESVADSGSARSKADGWMVPPGNTGTLGVEFAFMTSRGPLSGLIGNPVLQFTDVVFLRLQGRYSLAGVAELVIDSTLLPKQPSYTDELIYQNGGLGFRVGILDWLAATLRLDGGSTMAKSGIWAAGALGVEARAPIGDNVSFDLGLFGSGTSLFIEDEAPRFAEVGASGQILFYEPGGGGFWLGTTFNFPIAHKATTSFGIDPKVRVGVQLGAVLSAIDNWDLYAKFAYIDRGDLIAPETVLPILDGGFDQQVLTIGIVRRFGDEPSGNW